MYTTTDSLGHVEIGDGDLKSSSDQLRDEETTPYVPKWWNHDGSVAQADQILHEVRDRMGIYFMTKKLRYDTSQALRRKNINPEVRSKLMDLMALVDKGNPTPEEAKTLSRLYRNMRQDPDFMRETQLMLSFIRYG
jgi:hypothetical protein